MFLLYYIYYGLTIISSTKKASEKHHQSYNFVIDDAFILILYEALTYILFVTIIFPFPSFIDTTNSLFPALDILVL